MRWAGVREGERAYLIKKQRIWALRVKFRATKGAGGARC